MCTSDFTGAKLQSTVKNMTNFDTHNADGVPITTIHVSRIPRYANRSLILSKFGMFGRITHSYFKYAPNDYTILYCFITFSDKGDALKARLKPIILRTIQLKVAIADPWHQKVGRPKPLIKEEDKYTIKEDNILNVLNEDCFRNILSYLTIEELIRSERVCKKWRTIVNMHLQSYREFRAKTWKSNITLNTSVLYAVLKKTGRNMKILHLDQEWSTLEEKVAFIVSKFCPNLSELLVSGIRSRNWGKILTSCKHLKTLIFIGCPDVNDNIFKYCKAQLHELVVRDSQFTLSKFLTYIELNSLVKLEMVNLSVNECFLARSFGEMKSLTKLCLDNVNLSFTKINEILSHLPDLNELTLCNMLMNPANIEKVQGLKYLRKLHLSINTCLNNVTIRSLCRSCPRLKSFSLTRFDEMLSGENFVTSEVMADSTIRTIFEMKDVEVLNLSGLVCNDESFGNLEQNQYTSKLREIILRGNKLITEVAIINVFTYCPEIRKIDITNCPCIHPSFAAKLIQMIHTKECEPDRYSLITTWSENGIKLFCKCLSVKLGCFDDVFRVDLFDSEEEDIDSFDLYLDDSESCDSLGSFD